MMRASSPTSAGRTPSITPICSGWGNPTIRTARATSCSSKCTATKIYKYAVRTIPEVVKKNLEKSGFHLRDVSKVLIHQANEKMDIAILKRLFNLYGIEQIPDDIMPMIISWTGNSSVATLPTLLDLLLRGKLNPHRLLFG